MACLEVLQIIGFRSFAPEDNLKGKQLIRFCSDGKDSSCDVVHPLTLILGQNGCGKTTIIECLRYVTTGDCPPGSHSGRSFVHDPKMAKEACIKASVKLQFRANNNKRYILNRSMEAQVKARQISIKTLDATITENKGGGQLSSVTMKLADINSLMFTLLGVSKPILNYVIFCHQEDSNWPLDEGSKVKDKFDDIFASAKYKDCLKHIKDVRTKYMKLRNDVMAVLPSLVDFKNLAQRKRAELERKGVQLEDTRLELEKCEQELKPLMEQLIRIDQTEFSFSKVRDESTKARASMEHATESIREIRNQLQHAEYASSTTTDEDLERMKANQSVEESSKQQELERLNVSIADLSEQMRRYDAQVNDMAAEMGACKAKQQRFLTDQDNLSHALQKAALVLGWPCQNADFTDATVVAESVDNIKDTVSAKSRKLDEGQSRWQNQLKEKTEQLQQATLTLTKYSEQANLLSKEKAKLSLDLKVKGTELSAFSDLSSKRQSIECQLKDHEKRLAEQKARLEEVRRESKAEQIRQKISHVEELERRLRSERAELDLQREITSELTLKRGNVADRQKQIDTTIRKSQFKLSKIFGAKLPETGSLKLRFHECLQKAEDMRDACQAELQQLRLQTMIKKKGKSDLLDSIQVTEERICKLKRKLEAALDTASFDEFPARLNTAKEEMHQARMELQVREANKFTYLEFVQLLKQGTSCCPTCKRPFEHLDDAKELTEELEQEIAKMPTKVQGLKGKLERSVKLHDALQALMPDKAQLDALLVEVDSQKKQVDTLNQELQSLLEACAVCEQRLDGLKEDSSLFDELRDTVANLDCLHNDLAQMNMRVQELEAGHPDLKDSRSYESVMADTDKTFHELRQLRSDFEQAQEDERREEKELNRLQAQLHEWRHKKQQLDQQHVDKDAVQCKIQELQLSLSSCGQSLEAVDGKLGPARDQVQQLEQHLAQETSQRDAELKRLQTEVQEAKELQHTVCCLWQEVSKYSQAGNQQQLAALDKRRASLVLDSERAARLKAEQEQSRVQLTRDLANMRQKLRDLNDNLRLRQLLKRQNEAEALWRQAEQQLSHMDYDRVKREKEALIRNKDKLERAKAEKRGKLLEMENSLETLKVDMAEPSLKNADDNHHAACVRQRCLKHVIDDLNKYYVAMDWSIMRFHTERMKAINSIIRELWKATYKGNDIDYIEIQTDEANTTAGADKRKSYNYRVVMVKNETEMEMRGRCSAGQKVLASLIIRLALAETFSSDFGMMALDEPTTNLDRDNIESLAMALVDLVSKRCSQKNFQLIVITHDEDLISILGRYEKVNHFYCISKNPNGHSEIRKQRLD